MIGARRASTDLPIYVITMNSLVSDYINKVIARLYLFYITLYKIKSLESQIAKGAIMHTGW